jgi:hypothetical protein
MPQAFPFTVKYILKEICNVFLLFTLLHHPFNPCSKQHAILECSSDFFIVKKVDGIEARGVSRGHVHTKTYQGRQEWPQLLRVTQARAA